MVKKILLFIFIGLFTLTATAQFPAPYCAEAYSNGVEPITNVTFSNINNTTPATLTGAQAHQDFLSIVGNVVAGTTYTFSAKGNTDGNFTDYIRVFVDWNNDNDFVDAGESFDIGTITNSTGVDAIVASAAITIPATQPAGSRRMRVTKRYSGYSAPCNTIGFGQAEDYTLNITVPACITPSGTTVSAISATGATVSWTAVPGAIGYQYAVTNSATPPASGTNTAATSVNATGLIPNTAYFVHVRTACSGGIFSAWSTVPFTTLCSSATIPYSENFDGVTAPALPACIVQQDLNGASSWGNFSSPAGVIIGAPNSFIYAYSAVTPADDWFYLQGLNLTGGITYRLTFKWKSNPTYPERFEIKYGTSPDAASMTTGTLYTNNNAASSTVVTETIDFTPATTGVYYIGFHCFSVADQDFLAIDDINVALPPSCGIPTALSAIPTGTGTTANLSWAAPGTGTPTGYEWAVTTSATPPASGTPTTGTTASASGLTPATLYYLHVRTNCGAAGFSTWASRSFSTILNDECSGAIVVATQPSGPTCASTTAANTTGATISPQGSACWSTSLNDDIWYRFTATATSVTLNVSNFTVTTGTATQLGFVIYNDTSDCNRVIPANEITTSCPAVSITAGAGTATFTGLVVGNTYTLRLFAVGSANSASFNFCLQNPAPPPGCVTNVSPVNGASGVPVPVATVSWNAEPTATSYNVFFGTTNPPTANIGSVPAPATSVNVTGLAYSTTYYWYVVPVNSGGSATGCSTNVTSFTTGATPPNCVPFYGTGVTENCAGGDRIELFRLKGESSELNINTGTTCNSPTAYIDSTDHPVVINMVRGKSYWGQVRCGFSSNTIAIWIDFNDNGLFEASEKLMNNLVVGTTLTNINLFIPLSAAVGNHRMRVRDVYLPTGLIDACAFYTYGETEDYTVNIAAGGTSYTVSTYASAGACYTGAGSITVDALSNNNSNYVPLVDSSNALVAQLYPQNNNLGRVTTSYYKHNGAVRQDAGGRYYLDRNLTITVATQPTTPYNLRFPYQNSELNALIAQPGSGITSQFDLVMTKNGDGCLNAIGTGGTGGLVFFPTGFGSISGDRFIDVTNITGGFSSFYLHGGSTPIPVTLLDFQAQRNGQVNNLSWSTSQEVNSSHFVVERSNDGSNFTGIGKVNAAGNSSITVKYTFVDNSPAKGINYYRLRAIDRDNNGKYSAVRSVRNEGLADIAVYPNPVKDVLTVSITADKAATGTLYITDLSGKVLYNRTLSIVQGSNALPVNMGNVANGTYIIKVQLNGDIVVRKFNKM